MLSINLYINLTFIYLTLLWIQIIPLQVKRKDLRQHISDCREIRFSFAVGKRNEELRNIERKISNAASKMNGLSVEKVQAEIHQLSEQVEEFNGKVQLIKRYDVILFLFF